MGAKRSAKYLFLSNILTKLVTFAGSIVLARLLVPDDFGILLLVGIVTGFVNVLGNMGFEYFYLQEKTADQTYEKNVLHMTYKLRLIFNTLLFVIQYVSSYVAQSYFNNLLVGEMLRIFAFNYLIMIPAQINIFILRKKLHFKPEALSIFVGAIADITMKIILAMNGFGALSFAYGFLFGSFVKTAILMKSQHFIPNLLFWDKAIFEKIFFFGKHSFIGGIALYFSNQLDKIIMSSFFSTGLLGGYQFALGQVQNINSFVAKSFGNLIVSYIAKHKDAPEKIVQTLGNITYIQFGVMASVYVFLLFNLEFIVSHLFGEKWLFSVPLFMIFLLQALASLVYTNFANLLTGLGYPEVNARLAWFQLVVSTILLFGAVVFYENIVFFAAVFALINIGFGILKSHIGLQKLQYGWHAYLPFLRLNDLMLYVVFLLGIGLLIKMECNDGFSELLISFSGIVSVFYIYFIKFRKNTFMQSLSSLMDKHSKVYGIINKL